MLAGILLLGGVTSLPEVAASVTSSGDGDTALAANGILGGIAMPVTILAVADARIGRRALTSAIPDPGVFLQGDLDVLLLSMGAAIMVGDTLVLGAGLVMLHILR